MKEGTKLTNLLYDLPQNEDDEALYGRVEVKLSAKQEVENAISKELREVMINKVENLISVHSLLCLGFLWCQGSNKDKA